MAVANYHPLACNYLLGQMGERVRMSGLAGRKVIGLIKKYDGKRSVFGYKSVVR